MLKPVTILCRSQYCHSNSNVMKLVHECFDASEIQSFQICFMDSSIHPVASNFRGYE